MTELVANWEIPQMWSEMMANDSTSGCGPFPQQYVMALNK